MLTGDPDGCLAALGGPQVAPGHAEAPVVLRAVEVLHLLTRHVDHHLADLQPCRGRERAREREGQTTNRRPREGRAARRRARKRRKRSEIKHVEEK